MINKQMAAQGGYKSQRAKRRPVSKREKAHMYAAGIKKPPPQVDAFTKMFDATGRESGGDRGGAGFRGGVDYRGAPQNSARDSNYGGREPMVDDLSPLDQMELEHERNRYDVESIRRGYGV